MHVSWKPASLEEYAAFERALDQRIVSCDGVRWLRVRPFFYRPLSPFVSFAANSVRPPAGARLGAFQHSVPIGGQSNSQFNLLLFQNAQSYSAAAMDYNRRRQIRLAGNEFTIRPISDVQEFKDRAYDVYLSFVQRTGYQHGSQRQHRGCFCRWADVLFRLSKVVVLGGFRNGALGAVSLSFLLDDTLFYATFFCDTLSVRRHVADLMLHFVRQSAAQQGVKQIYAGMRKFGDTRVDDFYLTRGCNIVKKEAFLHVNPMTKFLLSSCFPKQYLHLQGNLDGSPHPADQLGANQEAAQTAGLDDKTKTTKGVSANRACFVI